MTLTKIQADMRKHRLRGPDLLAAMQAAYPCGRIVVIPGPQGPRELRVLSHWTAYASGVIVTNPVAPVASVRRLSLELYAQPITLKDES